MTRLGRADFDDADLAAKLAKASGMSADKLRDALVG